MCSPNSDTYTFRQAMIFGGITYDAFVAANIHEINAVLYAASVLIGIGAAAIWIGECSMITECSNVYERKYGYEINSQLGYFNGLFWMLFQCSQSVSYTHLTLPTICSV